MPYYANKFVIRDDMLSALEAYVNQGVPLGDFLRSVVCNDLIRACGHADSQNVCNIPAYAMWVYNECPALAQGSEDKYKAWLAMRDAERQAYISALNTHDWSFEQTDDHRVWCAGRESMSTIQRLQKRLDPEFVIWNQLAPERFRVPQKLSSVSSIS